MTTAQKIKVELIRQGKTQRWLCEEIEKRGIKCHEVALSQALHGFDSPKARDLISTSEDILFNH